MENTSATGRASTPTWPVVVAVVVVVVAVVVIVVIVAAAVVVVLESPLSLPSFTRGKIYTRRSSSGEGVVTGLLPPPPGTHLYCYRA